MEWSGQKQFGASGTVPFLVDGAEAGTLKSHGPLAFLKVCAQVISYPASIFFIILFSWCPSRHISSLFVKLSDMTFFFPCCIIASFFYQSFCTCKSSAYKSMYKGTSRCIMVKNYYCIIMI